MLYLLLYTTKCRIIFAVEITNKQTNKIGYKKSRRVMSQTTKYIHRQIYDGFSSSAKYNKQNNKQ